MCFVLQFLQFNDEIGWIIRSNKQAEDPPKDTQVAASQYFGSCSDQVENSAETFIWLYEKNNIMRRTGSLTLAKYMKWMCFSNTHSDSCARLEYERAYVLVRRNPFSLTNVKWCKRFLTVSAVPSATIMLTRQPAELEETLVPAHHSARCLPVRTHERNSNGAKKGGADCVL